METALKFKKGDKVVIITLDNSADFQHQSQLNKSFVIAGTEDYSNYKYPYRIHTGEMSMHFGEHELELEAVVNSPLWKALS